MRKIIVLMLTVLFSGSLLWAAGFDFNYKDAVSIKKDPQREVFKKPDGTTITKYTDREEAVFPDKTRIIKFSDGNRTIHRPDGTEISIGSDGTTVYRMPDGKIQRYSMDGKTPYGVDIQQQRRILRRKNFTVEIVYSAIYSDDVFNNYMKSFFGELVSQVQTKLWKMRVPSGRRKIVISNCRFGKTGFCKRKNRKDIALILFNKNSELKRTVLEQEDLLRKKKHPETAIKIVNELFE